MKSSKATLPVSWLREVLLVGSWELPLRESMWEKPIGPFLDVIIRPEVGINYVELSFDDCMFARPFDLTLSSGTSVLAPATISYLSLELQSLLAT